MEYIWILWDLFAVGILVWLVSSCARMGFIRTLIGFVGCIVSVAVARTLSAPAAEWLYENLVGDLLRMAISSRMDEALGDGALMAAEELLAAVPPALHGIIGPQAPELTEALLENTGTILVELLIREVLREPILSMLQGLCFLLIFSLSMLLIRYLGRLFIGLYRVPVLGTVNTVMGGIVGVLEGVLALYLTGILLGIVITATGNSLGWLNDGVIRSTFILGVFYR